MATLAELPIEEGWFRFSFTSGSARVYRCADHSPSPANCVGSTSDGSANETEGIRRRLATGNSSSSSGATWGDALCSDESYGPLCALCVEMAYFDEDLKACTACADGGGYKPTTMQLTVYMGIVLVVLTALGCYAHGRGHAEAIAERTRRSSAMPGRDSKKEPSKDAEGEEKTLMDKLGPKLKILWTFTQVKLHQLTADAIWQPHDPLS